MGPFIFGGAGHSLLLPALSKTHSKSSHQYVLCSRVHGDEDVDEEDVEDGGRNLDEYVDAIGDFTLKDLKGKKKTQIKKTVLQEVKGHKDLIEGATENAVGLNQISA